MAIFKLPELGEGLSEGELVAWRVKVGDEIKADSTMVEVMTDKATVEVPSPRSGRVTKLYYKPGELAKVGAPLIEIEESSGVGAAAAKSTDVNMSAAPAASAATQSTPAAMRSSPAAQQSTPTASPVAVRDANDRVLASPAIRKLAREKNIDLSALAGSGDRGRILRTDLDSAFTVGRVMGANAALQGQAQTQVVARSTATVSVSQNLALPESALEERIPFIGLRRKISDKLSESKFTAVHFSHFDEADFSQIMRLRNEMNKRADAEGAKLTYLPFFIKAAIAAIKHYPILNSTLDTKTNEVVIKHYYHFGISVQTDAGLMVAVVRDCDKKDVFEIARDIKEVADRARSGKASLQDLTGSTITITNPGNIGGLYATPVINFPETVILGMYQIKKRPVVIEENGEDKIVARPMMFTNITCDHRIVDGAVAAGYLRLFCDFIENPAKMAFA